MPTPSTPFAPGAIDRCNWKVLQSSSQYFSKLINELYHSMGSLNTDPFKAVHLFYCSEMDATYFDICHLIQKGQGLGIMPAKKFLALEGLDNCVPIGIFSHFKQILKYLRLKLHVGRSLRLKYLKVSFV